MEIGDQVKWVPSIEHQFDVHSGGFAWDHEILDPRTDKWKSASQDLVRNALAVIQRDPARRKELRATKPNCTYAATVTAVEDDLVSLDIRSPVGGVTLHYSNVPVDPAGKPGTCSV